MGENIAPRDSGRRCSIASQNVRRADFSFDMSIPMSHIWIPSMVGVAQLCVFYRQHARTACNDYPGLHAYSTYSMNFHYLWKTQID